MEKVGLLVAVSGQCPLLKHTEKDGTASSGNLNFPKTMTLRAQTQTLEITPNNAVYLNGDLYPKDQAVQAVGHLYALNMIDDVTFSSWVNALTKPN